MSDPFRADPRQAMDMILMGDPIGADRAAELGLVTGLFEPGTVLDAAVERATRIAGQSSSAVCLAKEAICRGECLAGTFVSPLGTFASASLTDLCAKPMTWAGTMSLRGASTTLPLVPRIRLKVFPLSWRSVRRSGLRS